MPIKQAIVESLWYCTFFSGIIIVIVSISRFVIVSISRLSPGFWLSLTTDKRYVVRCIHPAFPTPLQV